jgi:nitrogen PTS system EIIA component
VKITDILEPPMVMGEIKSPDKDALLHAMSQHLFEHGPPALVSEEKVYSALMNRERLGSTGVGDGVAIPHAKIGGLNKLIACFGRVPEGVAFAAVDDQPVKLVFVLLVPENSAGAHLKALARVSRLLKDPMFRNRLLGLNNQEALFEAFVEEDAKH